MKRTTLLLIFVLGYIIPSNAQFRSLLKKADKQYELHAFNLAIGSYKTALERRPDDPEALGKLADCYRNLNQMEDAAKWYAQAVKQRKVNPENIFNYGLVLKALGQYQEARQWFQLYAQNDAVVGNHFAQSCNFSIAQMNAPTDYQVSNELINTSASEFGPAFFGNSLVFSSARSDIQRNISSTSWTGKSFNQLFLANIDQRSGLLASPVFYKRTLDDKNINEGPLAFAPDNTYVIYTKNDFVDGTRHIASSGMALNIYTAELNRNGEWANAVPFPYNGTDYSTGFPSLSPDGEALYFASNKPDGFGGYDIYVSYRTGNGWSTPENMGPVINSPGNEVTPFFDGQALFFSSDWHQGMGGYDVFRADQNNGRWTRIVHLGSKVNSSRDDYSFIYDSFRNLGYLTSNRAGGRGNEDIYKVTKSGDGIVIRVKNASDGVAINGAEINFSDCNMGTQLTDANGIYSFQAVGGIDCNIIINKEGYISSNLNLSAFGVDKNRTYEVTLSKRGEEYVGQIVSYATRSSAKGITVIATNQQTGSYSETVSNESGEYSLALSPNAIYVLRYSGPGFRDVNRTVRTTSSSDRDLLGVISMLPSNIGDIPGDIEGGEPTSGGNTVNVQSGYAVQIAAISTPDMERFKKLEPLGQLYYLSEGRLYKMRLGVFPSRAMAENALKQVKASGFTSAFIVEERGGEVKVGGESGETFVPVTPDENVPENVQSSPYKIQLGAFKDATKFDGSRVNALGYIEDFKRNNLTIKLLAGFNTEAAARNALDKVQKSGFPGAFIVMEENGALKRIK